jgi:hypothetical protein
MNCQLSAILRSPFTRFNSLFAERDQRSPRLPKAQCFHALILLTVSIAAAAPAQAQFTGFSIPQTTQSTPFNAVACTGAQQVATVGNFGQTEHYITITTTGGVVAFRATVQGSHDGVTFNDISDVATQSGSTVMGQGYYPVNQISVTCATAVGSFTVKYSGQATAPAPQIGAMVSSQGDKTLAVGVAANANFTAQTIRSPFGNTGGALYFSYAATGPAGSILNVSCTTLAIGTTTSIASFPLATAAGPQIFPVSVLPCDFITVMYTSGGASATTFTASYVFTGSATISGGDPCQGSTAPKTGISISATATAKLGSGVAGHAFFVCGFNFTLAGGATPPTAQFQDGTGTTCGTGTVNRTGTMAVAASSTGPIDSGGGGYTIFKTTTGADFCIALAGTTPSAQGVVTVVQQ